MIVSRSILALIFLMPLVTGCASVSPSVGATGQTPRLMCKTIEVPDVSPNELPTKSCDDLCGELDAACVWNADNVNPHSCETPTAYYTCRCCHVGE